MADSTLKAPQTSNKASVESGNGLKLVGFHFGTDSGASQHVEEVQVAFRRKTWLLFKLREAGIKGEPLFKLYCCYYVSAVIKYCSVVYHSLLNKGQAHALERLDQYTVRVCLGSATSADETMEQHGIEMLEWRSMRRFDVFAHKATANLKFQHWFPRRNEDVMDSKGGGRSGRTLQPPKGCTTCRSSTFDDEPMSWGFSQAIEWVD